MANVIDVFLSDLDGVIRHFAEGHRDACEDRHGLARGALYEAAFRSPLIDLVVTGSMTRAEWTVEVGRLVGCPDAAAEWLSARGEADPEMLALIDDVRATGCHVAVLTNGTDTVPAELAELGITDRFDAVFSTSDIGFAKPDVRAFQHVVDALDCDPTRVLFTDDSERKLAGATELGMVAHHFTGVPGLRAALVERGGLDELEL